MNKIYVLILAIFLSGSNAFADECAILGGLSPEEYFSPTLDHPTDGSLRHLTRYADPYLNHCCPNVEGAKRFNSFKLL